MVVWYRLLRGSVSAFANGTGTGAAFNWPAGIAVDASDNLYIADAGNQLIRLITTGAVVSTIAGQVGVTGRRTQLELQHLSLIQAESPLIPREIYTLRITPAHLFVKSHRVAWFRPWACLSWGYRSY